jgi:YfiH family protein
LALADRLAGQLNPSRTDSTWTALQIGGLTVLQFADLAAEEGVIHFVSTRRGGASKDPYRSLNLGLHVGDAPEDVLANRQRLCDAVGVHLSQLTFGDQTHGATVRIVDKEHVGSGGSDLASAIHSTDGLLSQEPGACVAVMVADCVPVLMYDSRKRAVGAVHAGWRGTVAGIIPAAITMMVERLGSQPEDITACIGPAIGWSDYEVGPEVVGALQSALPGVSDSVLKPTKDGRALLNLPGANELQLLAAGLKPRRIHVAELSTAEEGSLFYSARRDGTATGRFAAGIMLRD